MLVESILQCSVLLLPHPPIWWFLPLYIFFQNHPPCPKYTQGKHNNNVIRERFFFLFWRLQNNVTFLFYKQPQAEIWFKTITANYDHYIEETSRQTTKYHKFPMRVTDISTTYPKLLLKKATSHNAHALFEGSNWTFPQGIFFQKSCVLCYSHIRWVTKGHKH